MEGANVEPVEPVEDVFELGEVSTDTKGAFGHYYDGVVGGYWGH